MNLSAPITALSGVGTQFSSRLARLDISSLFDLLYHLPFRYEDRSQVIPISALSPGRTTTVKGTITSVKNEVTKTGRFIQRGVLADASSTLDVIWFNQMFLVKAIRLRQVALYGKVDFFGRKLALISPEYEYISPPPPLNVRGGVGEGDITTSNLIHMGRVVPIYPETAGISSKWLRAKIFSLLKSLPDTDPWPAPGLPLWKEALTNIHFPPNDQRPATSDRHRLAFDELFLLQSKSLQLRRNWQTIHLTHPFTVDQSRVLDFISRLPFTLTTSQNQSIKEILSDLSRTQPMNRLLEGDVGSGKTVVAAIAAYIAHLNGFQTVLLAPTQILATQHYQTLTALFKTYDLSVGLVTSASRFQVSDFRFQIIVGTHALFSAKNQEVFKSVGLVIVDEQHRFGVLQRSLASQFGVSPHILTMTATPIPRSVALTMFGDLDLSQLTEKPVGRIPVKTWVIPESKRDASHKWIRQKLKTNGQQLFWVCPFIEPSESSVTVKAVTAEFTKLKEVFPDFRLGLLHGRLKSADKDRVINAFRAGEYDILVTTPIVEVGIDIPNASLIVIEAAERFGLAQLHQLRGRVGRSSQDSYCLLFTTTGTIHPRLKALETLDSGIRLAELDLKYRGPGEIYGTAQHGFPDFKIATFENLDLIQAAKTAAGEIIPHLSRYPVLQDLLENDKITLIQPN